METTAVSLPRGIDRRRFVWRGSAWALALVAVIGLFELAETAGVPVDALLADPVQAEGDSVFRGAVSSVFLLVWGVAAGALLVAGAVRRTGDTGFLVSAGALLLMLGVDDAALLHEEAADRLLGVQDVVVYGLYGVAAMGWLARYWRRLLRTDLVPLVAAGVGFGVSNLFDSVSSLPFRGGIEEPCKYFGLVAVCVWAFDTARRALVGPTEEAGRPTPTAV